jgi:hypothetical protein
MHHDTETYPFKMNLLYACQDRDSLNFLESAIIGKHRNLLNREAGPAMNAFTLVAGETINGLVGDAANWDGLIAAPTETRNRITVDQLAGGHVRQNPANARGPTSPEFSAEAAEEVTTGVETRAQRARRANHNTEAAV